MPKIKDGGEFPIGDPASDATNYLTSVIDINVDGVRK